MSVEIKEQSDNRKALQEQEAPTYTLWQIRLQLTKPLTWVGPVWAVAVGTVGAAQADLSIATILWSFALMFLIGPLVLGMGQSINDYYDADVDAINEPHRPCAREPRFKELAIVNVFVLGIASLILSFFFFPIEIFYLVAVGLLVAYIYSAPPLRLKQNGWWGNSACALTYVSLPWIAALYLFDSFSTNQLILALIYAIGSHGMMTLNDFKSVEGDKRSGLKSIVVLYGVEGGLKVLLAMMTISQLLAAAFVAYHGQYIGATILVVLWLAQFPFQPKLKKDPKAMAPWYNATANSFFIIAMMVAAYSLKHL
ncbi:(bacterio)chlorophyll synthase [Heliorestis convoluta]|uniref:Bacteriochlorophyll synthase BchG n=1 Tax=Heliorestis convoluta TaxID=356322 RepID=A0A5Q2N8Z7_9FIRM|nr:(bacterio)chlorophyll synthase [Heliorestis convoluta]QGG48730.1 Bacteriochlorophyll synthase BchG [Heliorestis convoluta]